MYKNIVVIPARGGSKRLPNKNIKLLNGKPLIAYSIEYARAHDFVSEVYVSTDSPSIKEIAMSYGVKVVDRPKSISGDMEPTVTALKHVLESIDKKVENVILLQVTNPLRPKGLLSEAIKIYNAKKLDALFTVSRNHNKLGRISNDLFEPFNYKPGQRSQDLEPLFYENGLLYITKASLVKDEIIIGENAYPLEIEHPFASIDIDTQDDFDYASYLCEKKLKSTTL